MIGQIKLTRIHVLSLSLSGVRIKQAAKHLFTMSKDPAAEPSGISIGNSGGSRLPNLLSNYATLVSVLGGLPTEAALEAAKVGGAGRNRTDDILLAKQTLSQLSYGPFQVTGRLVGPGGLEPPTSRLSGVRSNHLSYGPLDHARRPAHGRRTRQPNERLFR